MGTLHEVADSSAAQSGGFSCDYSHTIGSQSYASMILSGKREISKDNAKKLAERFKVDAGLFI